LSFVGNFIKYIHLCFTRKAMIIDFLKMTHKLMYQDRLDFRGFFFVFIGLRTERFIQKKRISQPLYSRPRYFFYMYIGVYLSLF